MTVVRISKGSFDASDADSAEALLIANEASLRDAIRELDGLLYYYVGIDRMQGYLTNVSIWKTEADAHQMDTLPSMLAQRPIMEDAGVKFEPITNHRTVWVITPDA